MCPLTHVVATHSQESHHGLGLQRAHCKHASQRASSRRKPDPTQPNPTQPNPTHLQPCRTGRRLVQALAQLVLQHQVGLRGGCVCGGCA